MSKAASGGGAGMASTLDKGHTKIQKAGGVEYRKSDRAVRNGDVAVKVSVAKVEKAWAKDRGYHLGKGAGGKLKTGKPIGMPQAHYDKKTGKLAISDGRHRTASIRDSGKKTMYITVSRGQAKTVKKDLGAD